MINNLLKDLSSIEEIIEDAKKGKMYILVDDQSRENEGDLIIPAQMVSADAVNFMAKYGRGLICLALSKKRTDELELMYQYVHIRNDHQSHLRILEIFLN